MSLTLCPLPGTYETRRDSTTYYADLGRRIQALYGRRPCVPCSGRRQACRFNSDNRHMSKKPHHSGTHEANSRRVRAAAQANPLTICWRCQRTLALHPAHRDGTPARWTAGHVIDGSTTAQPWPGPMTTSEHASQAARGDWLAPEASVCNYANLPAPATRVTTHDW